MLDNSNEPKEDRYMIEIIRRSEDFKNYVVSEIGSDLSSSINTIHQSLFILLKAIFWKYLSRREDEQNYWSNQIKFEESRI